MNILKNIPFFYGSLESKNECDFPEEFPFEIYFDERLRMFRQRSSESLEVLLEKVYAKGSLMDGSASSESGNVYVKSFVDYIIDKTGKSSENSFLEVGFGSGVMLKEFKCRGFSNLVGVEPGSHDRIDGLEGIKVIDDFFPSSKFSDKVDVIYSFAVLEHMINPVDFVKTHLNQLNDNGKIVFSVPNCEPQLFNGDLSVFFHEHYSYFTREAMIALAKECSLVIEDLSIDMGTINCVLSKEGKAISVNDSHAFDINTFNEKLQYQREKLSSLKGKFNQEDIAIYIPIRALNVMSLLGMKNVRLIDDSSSMKGRFLPFFEKSIESFDDILSKPPKCIIIFSMTFGKKIQEKCLAHSELRGTEIFLVENLIGE